MVNTETLTQALAAALPPTHRPLAGQLAQAIVAALGGAPIPTDGALAPLLQPLTGQDIPVGAERLRFQAGEGGSLHVSRIGPQGAEGPRVILGPVGVLQPVSVGGGSVGAIIGSVSVTAPPVEASGAAAAVSDRGFWASCANAALTRFNELAEKDRWNLAEFVDLEANIDIPGLVEPGPRGLLGGRREVSRTQLALKFLQQRRYPFTLLEGPPGSGKSVVLRRLGYELARDAREKGPPLPIPVYVNLRDLRLHEGEAVGFALIERFIRAAVAQITEDEALRALADQRFTEGCWEGRWIFLLDAFDEIPEVMRSTEQDDQVRRYSAAIRSFLANGTCKAVMASRIYRGPPDPDWVRCQLNPLSDSERLRFARELLGDQRGAVLLINQIVSAGAHMQASTRNPLFLSLLCRHAQETGGVPATMHTVFEAFVTRRLERDREQVHQRYGLNKDEIRSDAEAVAFVMASVSGVGLSAPRSTLAAAAESLGLGDRARVSRSLSALVDLQLAIEELGADGVAPSFSFIHRRLQEYFATCVALSSPDRVTPRALLEDGNWRETAVVMLQTQRPEDLGALFDAAQRIVEQALEGLPAPVEDAVAAMQATQEGQPAAERRLFDWPRRLPHLLELLQAGCGTRAEILPSALQDAVGRLLVTAYLTGLAPDRKLALSVAGTVGDPLLVLLLRSAFSYKDDYLYETAYEQAAYLRELLPDIEMSIFRRLIAQADTGDLWRRRISIEAHLRRLPGGVRERLLNLVQLLLWLPWLDAGAHLLAVIVAAVAAGAQFVGALVFVSVLAFVSSLAYAPIKSWPVVGVVKKSADTFPLPFMTLLLRMLLVMTSAGIISLWSAPLGIAALVVVGLGLAWAPLSRSAVESGLVAEPQRWPLLPIRFLAHYVG